MNLKTSLFTLSILLFIGCSQKENFTHTITSTEGINDADIAYVQADGKNIVHDLDTGDILVKRIDGMIQVAVKDGGSTTIFNDVPAKYINLDATVEVTRNVFQDYFPEEWEPMRGKRFTTLYIKSNMDNQVFYMKVVRTGTDVEIAKHSEDF